MKFKIVLLLSCLLYVPTVAGAKEHRKALLLYSNQIEDSVFESWLTKVYTELYRRVGYSIEIISIPEARATFNAEAGKIDGQFGRIYAYQESHTEQLRIDVPVYKLTIEAYVHPESNIRLNSGWSSFAETRYLVDYRRGVLICEQNLSPVVKRQLLNTTTSVKQGLLKVKHKRTDVFVQASNGVYPYLNKDEFKNAIVSAGVMGVAEMYPYIHRKFKHLIPQLETELNRMKEEGLILEYCKAFLKETNHLNCNMFMATR